MCVKVHSMERRNVAIPKSYHRKLKQIKENHGITLRKIIEQALDAWLTEFNRKQKQLNYLEELDENST